MFSRKTHPKISYAFLIKFLAGACVFEENTSRKKLCVSDHVPSRGFCFGVHLGSIWGPFGVHVGSMWAVGEQSELVTPSGEQFDPPWTDLGAFLYPMLAPCWPMLGPCLPHVGGRWTSWGILERSWSDLELILRPFLMSIEQRVKRRGWILEKSTKTMCFCWFFEVPEIPT